MGNIITLSILAVLLPLQAGIMAKSFGRNFWVWFFVTLPLPVIGNYILLCLGDKEEVELSKQYNRQSIRLMTNV
jgi:hypothetical protein